MNVVSIPPSTTVKWFVWRRCTRFRWRQRLAFFDLKVTSRFTIVVNQARIQLHPDGGPKAERNFQHCTFLISDPYRHRSLCNFPCPLWKESLLPSCWCSLECAGEQVSAVGRHWFCHIHLLIWVLQERHWFCLISHLLFTTAIYMSATRNDTKISKK